MGDDFTLPAGSVFPSNPDTSERPRRRSIDTPALRLDTSSVSSGHTVSVTAFPPPPKGNASKIDTKTPLAKNALTTQQNVDNNETTPVMRSMFPRFDPASQASRTNHVSSLDALLPLPSRPALYTPSLYSQPQSPPAAVIAADAWTAPRGPSRQYQRPSPRVAEVKTSSLSTPEQLLDLWTIALGQESPEALPKYTLGLKCNSLKHGHESISLVSSAGDFYAIKASGATMTITRKHPLNSQTGITIATPSFQTPTTTSPTVASLFPSIAEHQATASAKRTAAENHLSEQDATRLQDSTIQNARRTEAGALLWDSDSSSYYYTLPMNKEQPGTTSPLPIEYTPGQSIRFMNGSSEALLGLDLTDYSLVIETMPINLLSTSSYKLDILLSGIMTLALYLHRLDGVFSEPQMTAPYFAPPPKSVRGRKVVPSPRPTAPKTNRNHVSSQVTVPWLSRLNLLAARKQSTQPSNALHLFHHNSSALTFDKDLERGSDVDSIIMPNHRIPPMTAPPIASSGIAPELRGSNTGVDLSKFQAFDLEDPDLGGGTKAALRILYWAFGVIVWILGVFIGVLAAGIVAVGGCLGGGRGSREG